MLAARLAFAWGIMDVMGWIRQLPSGALDFWEAFDRVEPIGESWMQSALIARQASLYAHCKAGRDLPAVDDYLPPRYSRTQKRIRHQDTGTQFKSLLTTLGFKENAIGDNDQRG